MSNYAEVKPHCRGSFQDAQHAASAGSMRPPQAVLGCRPLLRAGKPRRYLLDHRHAPDECAAMYASWSGFAGRLRQGVTAASETNRAVGR